MVTALFSLTLYTCTGSDANPITITEPNIPLMWVSHLSHTQTSRDFLPAAKYALHKDLLCGGVALPADTHIILVFMPELLFKFLVLLHLLSDFSLLHVL